MQTRHFREWEAVFQKANSQIPQSNSRAQPKQVLPFTPSFCHHASYFILPHLSRRIIFSSNCNLFASSLRRLLFLHRVFTNCLHQSQRGICVHIIAQKCTFAFTWLFSSCQMSCCVADVPGFPWRSPRFYGYHIRSSAALVFLLPSAPYE